MSPSPTINHQWILTLKIGGELVQREEPMSAGHPAREHAAEHHVFTQSVTLSNIAANPPDRPTFCPSYQI